MDVMNSRDSFLSVLNMDGARTTPVFLRDLTLGMDATGIRTTDVFAQEYDSEESARSVLGLQRMIGHDAVVGCIHTYSLEAFGGVTKYPEYGIPYLSVPPFADIAKMDDFEPWDIDDALLKGMDRSYRIVRSKAPELAVVLNVGGPVNTAGNLRGIEQFMIDIFMEPEISKRLTEFACGVIDTIIERSHESCDAVFLASASDNPDMMGPDAFRELSLKNVRAVTERTHSMGCPVIFHPHGVFSTEDRWDILDESIATGIDCFQFAEGNEPLGIVQRTNGRCSVAGGVDAFTTLLLGPKERIERDTMRYINECGNDHIMTCSCSLNRGLPIDNVRTMVDTVRKHEALQ